MGVAKAGARLPRARETKPAAGKQPLLPILRSISGDRWWG